MLISIPPNKFSPQIVLPVFKRSYELRSQFIVFMLEAVSLVMSILVPYMTLPYIFSSKILDINSSGRDFFVITRIS